MSATAGRHTFPRGALIGAFGVVALSVLGAGLSRVVGPLQSAPPPAPVVAAIDLRLSISRTAASTFATVTTTG